MTITTLFRRRPAATADVPTPSDMPIFAAMLAESRDAAGNLPGILAAVAA